MKRVLPTILAVAAVALCGAVAALAGDPIPSRMDVLVIQRTPTGAVERTGYAGDLVITRGALLLDYTDDGEALFHNGFDASPQRDRP